jgi:hypothetical protein
MSQLEKRKFRKGAVHNRKKVFTENNENPSPPFFLPCTQSQKGIYRKQ